MSNDPLYLRINAIDDDVEAYKTQLEDLQGNILKSHGRGAAVHLFLTFHQDEQSQVRVRDFLRKFPDELTSAAKQREQAETYKDTHQPGATFVSLCLSAEGYRYLELDLTDFSLEFQKGMRGANLGDPSPEEWEPKFRRRIHAMLIFADDRVEVLTKLLSQRRDELDSFADVGVEFGITIRNADENPIEHFGYADGVSQPIFFKSDLKQTTVKWDPSAGPNLVLVKDPLVNSETACGTYFVFRKLEQNVRAFKAQERALANALELTEEDEERAGAMVVGRFENGTPIESHEAAVVPEEPKKGFTPENDFNYEEDPQGNKCPLFAHIRITNPRIDTEEERGRRITRRGITYGDPTPPGEDLDALPEGGVGLLFQCCQADLARQFEYLQKLANNSVPTRGPDPVIGQPTLEFPAKWNKPERGRFGFHGFVTMKGGEYFFVPSISFFKNLK